MIQRYNTPETHTHLLDHSYQAHVQWFLNKLHKPLLTRIVTVQLGTALKVIVIAIKQKERVDLPVMVVMGRA